MEQQLLKNPEKDLSIRDLVNIVLNNILIIFFIIGIFLSIALYYISTAQKLYSANSIFFIYLEEDQSNLGALGKLNQLVSISGLPNQGNATTDAFIERLSAREFSLSVIKNLNLQEDTFFNSYLPPAIKKSWKSKIKSFIGWGTIIADQAEIAKWTTLQTYESSVKISGTKAGLIQVIVNHTNPQRAAQIANYIANTAINLAHTEKIEGASFRLNYLSETLADALLKYETYQKELKAYALSNSTQAKTSLAAGSVLLDNLRLNRDLANTQIQAIDALKATIVNPYPSTEDYERLRKIYPLLDKSTFRRMLGISESISGWTWPDLETLDRVGASVRDRLGSLETQIRELEKNAKRYAQSADILAQLERQTKIAESTYTVLLGQVKSQSLIAGFTPNKSKVVAVADAPIAASSPKKFLIVAIAIVLGVFFGVIAALLFSIKKGVYHSLASLLDELKPIFNHKINLPGGRRISSLNAAYNAVNQRTLKWPEQLFLEVKELNSNSTFLIVDTTKTNYAASITRIIGATAGQFERSAAIVDLSRTVAAFEKDLPLEDNSNLVASERVGGCTEYIYAFGQRNVDWLFSKSFKASYEFLKSHYEIVLISSDHETLNIIQSSEIFEKENLIIYASPKKTKSLLIKDIAKRCKTRTLLHD